jgi:hypothetical protein
MTCFIQVSSSGRPQWFSERVCQMNHAHPESSLLRPRDVRDEGVEADGEGGVTA